MILEAKGGLVGEELVEKGIKLWREKVRSFNCQSRRNKSNLIGGSFKCKELFDLSMRF